MPVFSSSDARDTFLKELAAAASHEALAYFRQPLTITNKEDEGFDPVTLADKNAEKAMRAIISREFPEHGLLGEEFANERLDAEYVWVMDPIDGTRAFISGLPVWGSLVGLKKDGKPILGQMTQPFTRERYCGDGETAWYEGPDGTRTLQTRQTTTTLDQATLFTTTPALFTETERKAYDRLESAVRLPRYGCDCYAYCMVAAGMVDLVVESGLNEFDIMPLIPIIEGAGGIVTNWQGGTAHAGGQVIAAANRGVHQAALKALNPDIP